MRFFFLLTTTCLWRDSDRLIEMSYIQIFGQAVIAANYFAIFAIIAIFLKFVNNNEQHYVSMKTTNETFNTKNESET